jgi:hypothetical protein
VSDQTFLDVEILAGEAHTGLGPVAIQR